MRSVFLATLVLLGISVIDSSVGQTRAQLQRCRDIGDDARRLSCYDELDLGLPSPRRKYELVPLGELKSYALSYRGSLVEVDGWIRADAEGLLLGYDAEDDRSIPVDIHLLPRRQHELLMERCGTGCQATVQGRVGPVEFVTGVVADAVSVQ